MFVQATRVVPVPMRIGVQRLRGYLNLDGDVGADAVAAIREGHAVLDAGPGWVHKQVLVQTLRPFTDDQATVVPLRWVATGPFTSLLPVMDAHLELRPHREHDCHLTLNGSYRPPLGKTGEVIDRALLNTLAQATAKSFVNKVSLALQRIDTRAQRETSTTQEISTVGCVKLPD
jgi:hypothetical protein